ncbi:NAD(P)/FAD-dependent oxidoreductase [Sphingomonas sp. SUN039]|uniref:flavin-containing monooxygenase n=1 Tax=Sphingomonas sp. SUN039 TaxID=2937787 RepID=UPI002164427C|nr:NAD(P)/FAD-dependent oxidoreductase [Sphingomonas sp. SUN039]UVO53715.1 NAD(P)/FAD-dependent oxidoreductase [Sphingomonas sp. SUN039]
MQADKRPLRFVIIGAGMAGMLAGIRLKERGDTDFTIYEKGDSVGGTWRENSYPGLACDTPAHSYTYSFATNPEWSAFYAPGAEIRAYFEQIAGRYDLKSQIAFNTEISSCRFVDGRWRITTTEGCEDVADVIVAATGVLHHPAMPDIPGLEDFAGPCFHSARWDHSVPLEDKRVGVIGNGSTGVQIVSALSKVAGRLVHFQRSPQWIMPCPDLKYSEADKQVFRDDPAKIEEVRNGPEASARRARFTAAIIDLESPELAEIQSIVERNLRESISDPKLREKLRPDYRAACKRMVFSAHYYDAVQKPNVEVVVGAIERVEPSGIRMKDGSFYELDVIALATGFRVDQFVRPMVVEGFGGKSLDAFWSEHPRAYYAVTVPEFPNFFLLNGPTGPVGNFTLIDIAEAQWAYIDQLVDLLRAGTCDAVAPTMSALDEYEVRRTEAAKRTVFASGCRSWYLDKQGVPQVWPWSYAYFQEVMKRPKLEDYALMQGQ